MIEVYFFTYLLVGAGFQVSEPYKMPEDCIVAQQITDITKQSPTGRAVEKVYACQRGGHA